MMKGHINLSFFFFGSNSYIENGKPGKIFPRIQKQQRYNKQAGARDKANSTHGTQTKKTKKNAKPKPDKTKKQTQKTKNQGKKQKGANPENLS